MKIKFYSPLLTSAVFALAFFSSVAPTTALARPHSGPLDGTVDRHVTRSPGNAEKTATYTSPANKVSTREVGRITDPMIGNVSRTSTTTLANGKTANSNLISIKTDTGRATVGERTGFNGKTSTYNSTTIKTDTGFTREVIRTDPNSDLREKEATVTKQDGMVLRTATTTPPPKP